MKHFTSVKDIANLKNAVETALEIKKDRFAYQHLGKIKQWCLFFLIPVYVLV
jgi:N-succinyl-L-ornithine transcarbamylase